MEFTCFGGNMANLHISKPPGYSSEENCGWKKLCSTDCNGNVHSLDSPNYQKCYLNPRLQGRHSFNKEDNKKSHRTQASKISSTSTYFPNGPSISSASTYFPHGPPISSTSTYFQNGPSISSASTYFPHGPPISSSSTYFPQGPPISSASTYFQHVPPISSTSTYFPNGPSISSASAYFPQGPPISPASAYYPQGLPPPVSTASAYFPQRPISTGSPFDNVFQIDNTNSFSEIKKSNKNKILSLFETDNISLLQESKSISQHEEGNKIVNSELSYFSDKCSNDFIWSSKFKCDEDYAGFKCKTFTLFPEKSSSTPSIMDGFNSYFRKPITPRPRCLSDPQFSQQTSPDNETSTVPNIFSRCRFSSLPSHKGSAIELHNSIKEEANRLNNILSDDLVFSEHKATPEDTLELLTESSEPSIDTLEHKATLKFESPGCDVLPLSSVDFNSKLYSHQDQHLTNISKDISVTKQIESIKSDHLQYNDPFNMTSNVMSNPIVPFEQSNDLYAFPFKIQNLGLPLIDPPAVYYCIKAGKISYGKDVRNDWTQLLKTFQNVSLRKQDASHKPKNRSSTSQDEQKKNMNIKKTYQQEMECKFCKSNLEAQKTYKSHTLKQKIGKRTLVTCPVLRKLVCERCGETGDNAHTLSYCPLVIAESGKKPVSIAAELKKTKRISSGKVRRTY